MRIWAMERAIQTSARYFPENPLKLQEARYLRAFGTVAFVFTFLGYFLEKRL